MRKLIVTAAATALALAVGTPSFAAGNKTGFSTTSTSTQGSGGKTNTSANPSNQGQTTTTVSGPKGQVKQGKTANTTTSTDLPGKNR
jgi:hypothetical protein